MSMKFSSNSFKVYMEEENREPKNSNFMNYGETPTTERPIVLLQDSFKFNRRVKVIAWSDLGFLVLFPYISRHHMTQRLNLKENDQRIDHQLIIQVRIGLTQEGFLTIIYVFQAYPLSLSISTKISRLLYGSPL